ncbi:hypothetical protein ACFRLW_35480 [Streptomyces sp. NPDC056728]
MSVTITDPVLCTAVAGNVQQLRAVRFAEASHLGAVEAATMARVDQALRSVLDL